MTESRQSDTVPSGMRTAFMVEAFRPDAAVTPRGQVKDVHGDVLAVIDIPDDETVLVVLTSEDAAEAAARITGLGLQPIRVSKVLWDAATAPAAPDPAAR
jgi:hypothetical protein